MEGLVTPLQDRIEEWKKTANQLDKDHAKGEHPASTSDVILFLSDVSHWRESDTALSLPLFSAEYKRSRQEIKRKSLDTIKLQKKARKGERNTPVDQKDLLFNSYWILLGCCTNVSD